MVLIIMTNIKDAKKVSAPNLLFSMLAIVDQTATQALMKC